MHAFPGVHDVLGVLQASGFALGLITNGSGPVQREKIERFSLAPFFAHIQIEGEHGFGKPEERAYRHALASLNVEPRDMWIVGDNLVWEVEAPQKLGIHAVWYDAERKGLPSGSVVTPDKVIRRHDELLTMLGVLPRA